MVKEKKKLTHSDDEVKRYLGALTEHYTDGQKAVAEQYIWLREHLDKRFGQIDERLDRIDNHFERVDEKLDFHTEIINSHTEMLGNILMRLEEIKGEFKQKVDYQDFAKLQVRVAHLEASTTSRH